MAKDSKGHGSNGRGAPDIVLDATHRYAELMKKRARENPRAAFLYKREGKKAEKMENAAAARSEGARKSDAKPSPAVNRKGETFKPRASDEHMIPNSRQKTEGMKALGLPAGGRTPRTKEFREASAKFDAAYATWGKTKPGTPEFSAARAEVAKHQKTLAKMRGRE